MAGLNETASAERLHISFFGMRNAGKSSLVNAITNQELSIVSDIKGTTTDPVKKSMEILPLGPVVIIDTPGIDDEGELGELRIKKAISVLNKTDVAILVVDAGLNGNHIGEKDLLSNNDLTTLDIGDTGRKLIKEFADRDIQYIIAYNKCDIIDNYKNIKLKKNEIFVSATNRINIDEIKDMISKVNISSFQELSLVADFVKKDDIVILVMPQDGSAPKGRIILPQVQMIRDLLDNRAIIISVQTEELSNALKSLSKDPALVITDSQVFKEVDEIVPKHIKITSFSILLAKYKGLLDLAVRGVSHIKEITENDKVLMVEGCTHHRQCEDIGTVKIPNLLKKKLGFEFKFDTCSGAEMKEDLSEYKMIIHCGGCMLTEREVKYRVKVADKKQIPMTNYGILIAYLQGILYRSLEIMPDLQKYAV